MEVIIDRDRQFTFTREPANALEALAVIHEHLRDQGRMIVALKVDGKSLGPREIEASLRGKPVSAIGRMEVRSGETGALVRQALDELAAVLPELPDACRKLARLFQSESPEAGYEPFHTYADIWQMVKHREMEIINALQLDLDTLEVQGRSFRQIHEDLNGYLAEAAEAVLKNDCILLGDLLEYELAPRAELEMEIVALLRAHGGGQTG